MRRVVLFALLFVKLAFAQSSSSATTIMNASAIVPPTTLLTVQLTGTAAWHMGSDDDNGPITLKATRSGKSRMDLELSNGQHSEVRVNDIREPHSYVSTEDRWKESAAHNSWVDANWFFPAFSTAAIASERAFASTATTSTSVRTQFNISGQKPKTTQFIQVLSIADFDFDPATRLPMRMRWVTHPDDNFNVSIPFEIRYSDYRDVSGVKVPFHIERYFNGTLQLDITISNVVLNPAVSASDFAPAVN